MANDKISEYEVTATTINQGSFFDISQDLGGGVFQTQKLPANILTDMVTSVNIYNSDGILTSNRILDGFNRNLSFIKIGAFLLDTIDGSTLRDAEGGIIEINETVTMYSPSYIGLNSAGNAQLTATSNMQLQSTSGDVLINANADSKNIYFSTSPNGSVVIGSSNDPDSEVLLPVNGMIKYSESLNQFRFRENGIWRTFSAGGGGGSSVIFTSIPVSISGGVAASFSAQVATAGITTVYHIQIVEDLTGELITGDVTVNYDSKEVSSLSAIDVRVLVSGV